MKHKLQDDLNCKHCRLFNDAIHPLNLRLSYLTQQIRTILEQEELDHLQRQTEFMLHEVKPRFENHNRVSIDW